MREELPVAAAPYITFRLGFTEKFSLGVFMTELEKTSLSVIGIGIRFRVNRWRPPMRESRQARRQAELVGS